MLALFAVAIALAVIFPYQDVNELTSTGSTAQAGVIVGDRDFIGANGKPAAVELDDGAAKSDVVAGAADYVEAIVETDGQKAEPEDDIIMKKEIQLDLEGEQTMDVTTTTTELVVDPVASETDVLGPGFEVSNGEDAEPSDETGGLFSHVAEPENGQDEQGETSCTSLLQEADIDENEMLSTSEYVSFLHSIHSTNVLSLQNLSDEYASLTFGLRLNFLHQQCKCPQTLPECCENENGVYIGDESAAAEFCRTTIEVGLEGKAKR